MADNSRKYQSSSSSYRRGFDRVGDEEEYKYTGNKRYRNDDENEGSWSNLKTDSKQNNFSQDTSKQVKDNQSQIKKQEAVEDDDDGWK